MCNELVRIFPRALMTERSDGADADQQKLHIPSQQPFSQSRTESSKVGAQTCSSSPKTAQIGIDPQHNFNIIVFLNLDRGTTSIVALHAWVHAFHIRDNLWLLPQDPCCIGHHHRRRSTIQSDTCTASIVALIR